MKLDEIVFLANPTDELGRFPALPVGFLLEFSLILAVSLFAPGVAQRLTDRVWPETTGF